MTLYFKSLYEKQIVLKKPKAESDKLCKSTEERS